MSEDYTEISRTRRRNTSNATANSDEPKQYIIDENLIPKNFSGSISSSFTKFSSSFWKSAQQTLSTLSTEQPLTTGFESSENNQATSLWPNFEKQPVIEMPIRDRTNEFRTTAKSYQMKFHASGQSSAHKEHNSDVVKQSVQFNQLARRIGRDLSLTCAKMEKLTELAKNKSLFDDRINEIENLSKIIKQDITGLNKQIASLQEHCKGIGTNDRKNQGHGHSKLVVVGLQSKLATMSKDFQDVLEIRTENLKHQKSRREKFSQCQPVPSTLPLSVSNGNLGSVLLRDEIHSSSSVALDMHQLEQERMQHQVALIDEQEMYVQARSSTMESIESSISELGQIFRQLASLVSEQGEAITRIDSNVEDTVLNVDAAHHELVKYFHSISQNRTLMIKVFGVLIGFIILFIIFLS